MEKGVDGGEKVPRIVQVMYFQQMPRQAMPPSSSQPPDNAMPQQWESQWQEFLKTLQPAQLAMGNPPVMESSPWEDAKAFLSSFEEVAEVCQWPRDEWVGRLLPALRGGVKQCLWQLHARDRRDYEKVKSAILRDDAIRTEKRRQHFRQCGYQEGPRRIYRQLQELCRQWLKPDKHTKEQILELIIQEQLLAMLPQEIQRMIKECGTDNCIEMVTLAENFLVSCQTAKTQERPVPEGTVGSRETEGVLPNMAHRQFCVGISRQGDGEIGSMANATTSVRNSGVALPPSGPEMTGAQVAEEPVNVKNTALDRAGWPAEDLDQKPSPWELMRATFGNATVPDGLLIPTPDSLSQPEQQETQIPGQTLPDSLLGDRLPGEIKGEDSDLTDVDDDMPVLSPEECQDNASASLQPENNRELHPRNHQEEEQGPGRRLRKRGTMEASRKNYLANKEKKHECSVCGHKVHFLSALLRHMKRHAGKARAGKRPYRCLECGISFRKVESYQSHQRMHISSRRNNKKFQCGTCGFKAESFKHLSEHMKGHTGEKPFPCTECGQAFRWRSILSRHMKLHEVRKNLGVRQLMHRGGDGRGKLKNYSLQHYRIRLEDVLETPSEAAADGREPSVSSRLRPRRPQMQDFDPAQLEWSDSEDSFETVRDRPVSKLHSPTLQGRGRGATCQLGRAAEAVKRSINYRKKNHACQQCDYRSERLSDVVKHMRVHTQERPYSCHECGITFRWPSNYRSHMKICAASLKTPVPAEPPVAECDVTLSDEEELINILQKNSQQLGTVGTTSKLLPKEQKRIGRPKKSKSSSKDYKTKERKHECSICGHRTFYLSDLIRHHRVHTREKPSKCLQCGKSFTKKATLLNHKCVGAPSSSQQHKLKKASSVGEKNYSCSKCGHRASKLAALLKHMRVHLGERTYKCQECGEAFAWQSNLCRHQRTHHLDGAPGGIKTPIGGQQEMRAGNKEPSKMLEETSQQERTELKATSSELPEAAPEDVAPTAGNESSKEQESTPGKEQAEAAKGTEDSTIGMALLKLLNLEKFAYSKGEKSDQTPSEPVPNPGVSIKEEPCEISVSEKSDSIKCSLTKYQNEEADEKPHLCEDCGECFPMKAQLIRHQQTHAGAKSHQCSACGNTYSCQDDLTAHLKTHDLPATTDVSSLEEAAAGALGDASGASDRTESS